VPHVIRQLEDADLEAVVGLSLRAWAPVFASLEAALGPNVYGLLFPDWRSAQANAVEATFETPENDVWVAVVDGVPVGFVAFGLIDEDATRAGEIHMIAVDPAYQGTGIGASLLERAVSQIKAWGVDLAVVATAGDPGHAPARALYERHDFNPLPLVRYYREL
jgi:GNAT superfamily N-acetyltransferase